MTNEEKAKAYDEALKLARMYHDNAKAAGYYAAVARYENIFPELRESEDERIREALCKFISDTIGYYDYGISKEEALAYLEKQKEQKPAEFTHHETNESLKDAVTHQMEDDGDIDDFVRKGIDDVVLKYAKLGAKWQKEHKPVDFPTTDEEVNEFLETHPKVEVPEKYKTPDFVFKKKEYESYPIISKDTTSVKSAEWSEEDADMLNCCISSIEEAKENRYAYKETDGDTSYDREIDWLKSLRPQSKQEWSEEDEEKLNNISEIIEHCTTIPYSGGTLTLNKEYKKELQCFIKSLRPSWKPSEEQINALYDILHPADTVNRTALEELYEQLKSIQ